MSTRETATTSPSSPTSVGRAVLSKVPEVTIFFWIVKILCTTVGETLADYMNNTVGLGLGPTTLIFMAALAGVLIVQFRLPRYVPGVYWLAVVLLSVVGTLLTDNLTDNQGVPLWASSLGFAAALGVVFAVWYAREGTLSIHSIVTAPREAFYWLTVLVTFALGTAAGDWTLTLTGWGPSAAALLPAGLIALVALGWRAGVGAVLTFWVAYILTRPLGANLGDLLGSAPADGGVGLGTFATSMIFLAVILGVVSYLTVTKRDQLPVAAPADATPADPVRSQS